MYIKCPSCNTNFVISASQIGAGGRRVKCSKCSHAWHVNLSLEHLKEELAYARDYGVFSAGGFGTKNLPAVIPVKVPIYLYVLPFILISLISFLLLACFYDQIDLLKELEVNKHIKVDEVYVDSVKNHKIAVHYKIVNTSSDPHVVPLIRIRLLNDENEALKEHFVNNKVLLEGKSKIDVRTEFTNVPKDAKKFDITLGNRLDFLIH